MHTTRILAAAAVAAAVAVPGTAGAQQSFVTPDAYDAGHPSTITPLPRQDLVTPDARAAADPRPATPPPTVVRIVEPAPSPGFRWGDAGIGAAGTAGIVLAAVGIGLPLAHRRRDRVIAPG